jgi:hypothetical protein
MSCTGVALLRQWFFWRWQASDETTKCVCADQGEHHDDSQRALQEIRAERSLKEDRIKAFDAAVKRAMDTPL